MSARTGQVLIADSFHDGTNENPAMKWMEKFTVWVNSGDRSNAAHWYSPTFHYTSADGVETPDGEPAWTKMYDEYDTFYTAYHHEPYSMVCFEAQDHDAEYEMVGQAMLYGNLVGDSTKDHTPRVTNAADGKEWDIVRPGAWHFWYEKTDDPAHEGYQMKRLHLMIDSGPVVARLIHRGHLNLQEWIDMYVVKAT